MADSPASSRPRALFLAPEAPYPLTGGGPLRSASLLQYLACRYEVDLIVFQQHGAPDPVKQIPSGLAQRIFIIDLPAHSRSRAARALRNGVRLVRGVPPLFDRFSGFEQSVAAAISGRRYAVGVIEHFWCAPYWEQIHPACARTILNLHNIESVLHARCAAAERGAAGLVHEAFGRRACDLERSWFPRFSDILTTSEPDRAIVLDRAPDARVTVYPNAVPLAPLLSTERDDAIVFSGNLEYHPNVSAVRFFRREVWPRLRERWPGLVWRLLGKNPQVVKAWTSGDPRIEVCGPVQNAVENLARAKVAVVPILAGSGTRLKILEAWNAGIPVVSTRLGAEGLPGQDGRHLLLADGAQAFAGAVSRLLEDPDLQIKVGREGRMLLEQELTWEKVWRRLDL